MARTISNPVKANPQKLTYKQHRVIIPFYIPNTQEPYFVNMIAVLRQCLESLLTTINQATTAITLINNASCEEASALAESYFRKGMIDRYIVLQENRGKVEPCLLEVHSSLEDYVTISDADILFYDGWEKNVFDVFNNIPKAGAVSLIPSPNSAFYCNTSPFMGLFNGLKLVENGVHKESLEEFAYSTGNTIEEFYSNIKDGFSWYEKQFLLEKNGVKACVGAGHCCTTYKRFLLDSSPKRQVGIAFSNGLEYSFFDQPVDFYGYYRLSTIESQAYHLGNNPEPQKNDRYGKLSLDFTIEKIHKKKYLIRFFSYNIRNKFVSLYRLLMRIKQYRRS